MKSRRQPNNDSDYNNNKFSNCEKYSVRFTRVVFSKQLHTHNGKYEYDYA